MRKDAIHVKPLMVCRTEEALVDWWNERTSRIAELLEADPRPRAEAVFSWSWLVWQELRMWRLINEPVLDNEVDWLVHRRGFNDDQRAFLVEGAEFLGLRPAC